MRYLKFAVVVLCFLFVFTSFVFAGIKDMSKDEWASILKKIDVQADALMLEKLVSAGSAFEKIEKQTKGSINIDNWVQIFKKLDIEPKENMSVSDWQMLLNSVGITLKSRIPETLNSTIEDKVSEKPSEIAKASYSVDYERNRKPETGIRKKNKKMQTSTTEQKVVKKFPKISLDFKEMDMHATFKIISQKSGMNIVAGKNVRGKVSIYLKDIDALEGLRLILEMNDLAYIEEDDVIKVITLGNYEKLYGKKFYDRTVVEMITLNHVKVENIKKTIMSLKSKIGQIVSHRDTNAVFIIDTPKSVETLKKVIKSLDTERETKYFILDYADIKSVAKKIKSLSVSSDLKIDERNNKLIVRDIPEKLKEIAKLIESFDERPQEVLIEAKIVQVSLNDDLKMGVNWDSVFKAGAKDTVGGNILGNMGQFKTVVPNPLSETGLQFSVGTIEVNDFKAVFDLLETVGKTNLVSTPRIATLEDHEAKILVGTREAYVTTQITNPGTTTTQPIVAENVQFVDVGIKLFVTPKIASDGFVTMKIRPEVSSVARTIDTAQGNKIPIVRTSESETNVMVKDGVTIVIAGLIEEKDIKKIEGVPVLCRIPLLGTFFRKTTKEKVKTELMVFLTPRLMTGGV